MKICIVTGTRAEYGLLKPLLDQIKLDKSIDLQVLVTGAHLSPEFGLTYRAIIADQYPVVEKVEMLLSSDSAAGIVKSMGLGMIGYADVFERLAPDLLVILGDRYEMLAVASSAIIFKIPIAHIHGGEITEGAYDDAIRHAITKMSSLHFASTEEHRNRIIQMGEHPSFVFNVGAIGLDNLHTLQLLSKEELEHRLNITLNKYNFLITFHPETLSNKSSADQFAELLKAFDIHKDSLFIFTKANADTDGRVINNMIEDYVYKHPERAVVFSSMGQLLYFSTMQYVTAVVGNSSSGIIEAPSFNIPTINIGNRQKGRIQSKSVINVDTNSMEIHLALSKVTEMRLQEVQNPYGSGNSSPKILSIINETDLKSLLPKAFYNINV